METFRYPLFSRSNTNSCFSCVCVKIASFGVELTAPPPLCTPAADTAVWIQVICGRRVVRMPGADVRVSRVVCFASSFACSDKRGGNKRCYCGRESKSKRCENVERVRAETGPGCDENPHEMGVKRVNLSGKKRYSFSLSRTASWFSFVRMLRIVEFVVV